MSNRFALPATSAVYRMTDMITGVSYVGASRNVRARAVQHFSELNTGNTGGVYRQFAATYARLGALGFNIEVLEQCPAVELVDRERHWIETLQPEGNTYLTDEVSFTPEEREQKAERVRKLWATEEYREKAVAARKGNTFAKGHKCTPEQVENRRRAARISNMKRNYGDGWQAEYARRYPEHAGDLHVE